MSILSSCQVSKKYVSKELAKEIHAKAAPFVKWLREAEEESEGSGEDGEDDEDNVEVNTHLGPRRPLGRQSVIQSSLH